ncbi:MAG: NAD(P)/FAD-dependent oxidoreductase [Jaaginema sp. PMC 1080.18]|nr:NAD(P)/FAD-dependent oxidoreductase [Jaaginema sp. PMC 1080.18]MEC4866794.1 NAD(P)/FAD-dependent oxidoreductase [Jaaginema sp. PMC 1078.18]
METYDAIAIGAGHNGLVCAAYLLKAGYSVLLLEKRPVPGGAATTEAIMPDTAPGFVFNRCAIDHEFIHLGPVAQELELHKYGLKYLPCDPVVFCPHPDGKYFLGHQSVEKTSAEIARYSDRDAQRYLEYTQYWQSLVNAIAPMFNAPPTALLDITSNFEPENFKDLFKIAGSPQKALDFVRTMLTSPIDVIEEWFETEIVKAPLARLAAEIGAPPSQKGLAIGAMMMSMRHNPGMSRPKGGTGALVDALVKLVTSLGGKILTDTAVKEVLIDDSGQAVGVRTATGQEYRASRGIISNIDVRRLFLQLMDSQAVDEVLRDRVEHKIINSNEAILKVDCALSEAPRFEAYDHKDNYLIGSILIADSVNHVEKNHGMTLFGEIAMDDPSMYAVCPTVLDPSMAPDGQHTLWIEFFAPYQVAGAEGTGLNGTGWTDDLKEKVGDRVIEKLAQYAPNLKDSIIARQVESPAEIAERLGSYNGNVYHIDMSLDRMIFLRPLPEIANYTTPIKNLYLSGAGAHPGGSISGMPGRNCANVFLRKQQGLPQRMIDAQGKAVSGLRSLFGAIFS